MNKIATQISLIAGLWFGLGFDLDKWKVVVIVYVTIFLGYFIRIIEEKGENK